VEIDSTARDQGGSAIKGRISSAEKICEIVQEVHLKFPPDLICPIHRQVLQEQMNGNDDPSSVLICPEGCAYPKVKNIFRFVVSGDYADAFGLQWNSFRQTQLDSFTRTSISRDRLTRLMGGSLEVIKGKTVLEAGCGAGRFSEIILESGAKLVATDLSSAVEANYRNCRKYRDYLVLQADILNLPLQECQFDIVVCIGVIQHTPDPEATIKSLCSYTKPGGMLVLDHYARGETGLSPRMFRWMMLRLPSRASLVLCRLITEALWPFHRMFWKYRHVRRLQRIRYMFSLISPVMDYHHAYPQLGPRLLKAWAALDTHDSLTDVYKHQRSIEEIVSCLEEAGMVKVEAYYGGNGVEARALKPNDSFL
jgi:SAM-dependent methyltransferase